MPIVSRVHFFTSHLAALLRLRSTLVLLVLLVALTASRAVLSSRKDLFSGAFALGSKAFLYPGRARIVVQEARDGIFRFRVQSENPGVSIASSCPFTRDESGFEYSASLKGGIDEFKVFSGTEFLGSFRVQFTPAAEYLKSKNYSFPSGTTQFAGATEGLVMGPGTNLSDWIPDYFFLESDGLALRKIAPNGVVFDNLASGFFQWVQERQGIPSVAMKGIESAETFRRMNDGVSKGWCSDIASAFTFASAHFHHPVRYVSIGRSESSGLFHTAHAFNERYLPERGVWEYVDMHHGVLRATFNGHPLNAVEFRDHIASALREALVLDVWDSTAKTFVSTPWPKLSEKLQQNLLAFFATRGLLVYGTKDSSFISNTTWRRVLRQFSGPASYVMTDADKLAVITWFGIRRSLNWGLLIVGFLLFTRIILPARWRVSSKSAPKLAEEFIAPPSEAVALKSATPIS